MKDNAKEFLEFAKACCDELSTPAERDKCYRKISAKSLAVAAEVQAWQAACVDSNQDAQNAATSAVKTILLAGALAKCGEPGSNVDSNGQLTANIVSPVENADTVSLLMESQFSPVDKRKSERWSHDDSSSSGSQQQRLQGIFQVTAGDDTFAGDADASIAWGPGRDSNEDDGTSTYKPTTFRLSVNTGIGAISCALLPHSENRIEVGTDGDGTFKARVSLNTPSRMGIIVEDVWIEVPIEMAQGRISFTASAIPALQFMPLRPSVFADRNRDWEVNMLDYLLFFEEFAAASLSADVNHDGELNDVDIALFEEHFYAEFGG